MKVLPLFLLILTVSARGARPPGEEGIRIPSSLKSATVYRSGAELVHTAKATLKQGNNELIIEDISNNIDIGSIRVGCTGTVTILSVEFSKEYLKPETPSVLVRKLKDSLENVRNALGRLAVLVKSDNDLLELLSSNKKIGGEQNGLSVAELSKMMDYYKQKSLELRTELAATNEKQESLNRLAGKLESQIEEEDIKNTKTSGRLYLQLLSPLTRDVEFTVSYLTPLAYWNPGYDLRVDNINDPLKLVYKARLVQTSGIDWKKVKLSLSTAVPSQGGNAPLLHTWFLRFVDPVAAMENELRSNTLPSTLSGRAAGVQLNEVVGTGYGVIRGRKSMDSNDEQPIYVVDDKVMSAEEFGQINPQAIKDMKVLSKAEASAIYGSRASSGAIVVTLKQDLGDYVSVKDNAMNVVFDIDTPYDVPTNGKEQYVILKEYTVPVSYRYYAVPVLDKNAYLLGEVPDWEKLNLLPGEANILFEGTYTGKSTIDPGSTQDTLNLTLGADKRVVVKREKVTDYSSVKFLGSNKKQVFTYEITVRNNKKEKIQLLLKDQYPIPSTKDIEVELLEATGADVNSETGVLTWKPELAAGEIKKFRISYSLKYPRDKTVNSR